MRGLPAISSTRLKAHMKSHVPFFFDIACGKTKSSRAQKTAPVPRKYLHAKPQSKTNACTLMQCLSLSRRFPLASRSLSPILHRLVRNPKVSSELQLVSKKLIHSRVWTMISRSGCALSLASRCRFRVLLDARNWCESGTCNW